MDIRRLVNRIADALGPEADPAQVETVAAAVLDLGGSPSPPAATAEGIDIQAVTLGISLRDCSSRLPQTVRARAYDKIRRTAAHFAGVAEEVAASCGAGLVDKHLAVTPVALIADGLPRDELIGLAQLLDTAAEHVGIAHLDGFSAFVEEGMTAGGRALLDALPAALATTTRLTGLVNCASSSAGLNAGAVLKTAEAIRETARLTADRDAEGCTRLSACCNAAGFPGPGAPEAVVDVAVSGPGLVLRAVQALAPDACLGTLFEAVKRTAAAAARAGEHFGRQCAEQLDRRTGVPVTFGGVGLSLAAAPAAGPGAVVRALGLEDIGAPGTTAALALLHEAVRQGGLLAVRHMTGPAKLSVDGDPGMAAAAAAGHVSFDKLEAMRAVCSAGLDLVVIPGDTPPEAIAGILLDAFALGLLHRKPTGLRVVPVPGKSAGDYAAFDAGAGRIPVLPVSSLSAGVFARRGGRIPV